MTTNVLSSIDWKHTQHILGNYMLNFLLYCIWKCLQSWNNLHGHRVVSTGSTRL